MSYQQWIIDKAIGMAYHRRIIDRKGARYILHWGNDTQQIAVRGVVEFITRRRVAK